MLENVANNQLKSNKRAKRETQDPACIWTGVHIVVSDNDKEENECYCDDGKECSYGHKKVRKYIEIYPQILIKFKN